MELRPATADDVAAIARLHADSWSRSYRGIYSDAYLDEEAPAERLVAWTERFANPRPDQRTVLAIDAGELVGFVHTVLDDDPHWGALLDNLHVRADWQRRRLGSQLVAASARAVVDERPGRGLYLWVLEPNIRARAFYAARGGSEVDRVDEEAVDGSPTVILRVTWPDPSALLLDDEGRGDE
jgi:ribosomal protein S18 acetylase RimI-like enzyme